MEDCRDCPQAQLLLHSNKRKIIKKCGGVIEEDNGNLLGAAFFGYLSLLLF